MVRVVYPGRVSSDQGADFQDAVIVTSEGLVTGDIEVHTKASGWQAHRHHRDPACQRVVLHVVMQDDKGGASAAGKTVPTVVLEDYAEQEPNGMAEDVSGLPCTGAGKWWENGEIGKLLDDAGEERFLVKAQSLRTELLQIGAEQCLYQGLMGALGYTKNKAPFLDLARRLTWEHLRSLVADRPDDGGLVRVQAALLGTAGLLPSQRSGCPPDESASDYIAQLEWCWSSLGYGSALHCNDWHLYKVRPGNHPVRRIIAASHLVRRYHEEGLLNGLVGSLMTVTGGNAHLDLAKLLMVVCSGYWAGRFDFGGYLNSATLVGRERAAEMVVNVLLPFSYAWSQIRSDSQLPGKAVALYRSHPLLPVNSVVKHMVNQLGLEERLVDSALWQQGLLHIYRTRCTKGRCGDCRLAGTAH